MAYFSCKTAQAYERRTIEMKQNKTQAHRNRNSEQPKEKDPIAVELGRRGGLKGGRARAAKLSAAQRTEIAKKAAQTRWGKV